MGLFTVFATAALSTALFLFGPLNLCAPVSAQNSTELVATPVDAFSTSVLGESFFIYSPTSNVLVSPSGNSLDLVALDDYDNNTMQWNLTQVATSTTERYIIAANPQSAGCSGNAYWNVAKNTAVTTLCSPATSNYMNLLLIPVFGETNTYYIAAASNAGGCVTVDGSTINVPGTVCTRLVGTQWQFVTLSYYYY